MGKKRGGQVIGIDVSNTAIEKAKARYPNIQFFVKNIIYDNLQEQYYDLIVVSEVLWYILDNIKNVFNKLYSYLKPLNGILGIHQYFPDDQRFGKHIINGVAGFEAFIEKETNFVFEYKVISFGKTEGKVLLATFKSK